MIAWTERHGVLLVELAKACPALNPFIRAWVAWAIRRAERLEARA